MHRNRLSRLATTSGNLDNPEINDLIEEFFVDHIFIVIASLLEYFYGYTYNQTQIQLIQKFNSPNSSYHNKLPYFLEEEYKRSKTNFISTILPFFDESYYETNYNQSNNYNMSQYRDALDKIYKKFHQPEVYEGKTDKTTDDEIIIFFEGKPYTTKKRIITDYSSLIDVIYLNQQTSNTIHGILFRPNKFIRIGKLFFLNIDDINKYKAHFGKEKGRRFRPGMKTIYAINMYAKEHPDNISEDDNYIIVTFQLDSDLYRYYNEGIYNDFREWYNKKPQQNSDHNINKNFFTWANSILQEGFGKESTISKEDGILKIKKQ